MASIAEQHSSKISEGVYPEHSGGEVPFLEWGNGEWKGKRDWWRESDGSVSVERSCCMHHLQPFQRRQPNSQCTAVRSSQAVHVCVAGSLYDLDIHYVYILSVSEHLSHSAGH